MKNVGADIADVASESGWVVRPVSAIASPHDVISIADAAIIVMPVNPVAAAPYMLLARDLRVRKFPVVYYGPVEGRPSPLAIQKWMLGSFPIVAPSEYVRDKLVEVGFGVVDVVRHGVNLRLVERSKPYFAMARNKVRRGLENKVVFGTVAFYHVRKGLERLADAIRLVTQEVKDVHFIIVTTDRGRLKLGDLPNTTIETAFGARSRQEVFAWYSALDWVIIPSLAEGFGLPLIEANAVGAPVIHNALPPLMEITDETVNIVFQFDNVYEKNVGDGIVYEMHDYNPERLAKAILKAYDETVNARDEYVERKKRAIEHARRYDIRKLYPHLLKLLSEVT